MSHAAKTPRRAGPAAKALTIAATGLAFLATLPASASALRTGFNGERTVELVSTAPKDVSVIGADITRDGNGVLYRVQGGTDLTSYGVSGTLVAERTPTGWTSSDPFPPRVALGTNGAMSVNASPDFNILTIQAGAGFGDSGPATLVRYDRTTGELSRGATVPTAVTSNLDPNVASDDQRHVVTTLDLPTQATRGLFEVAGPTLQNIGLLPDGTAPACGVSDFSEQTDSTMGQHWISVDGDRVFFQSRGNSCSDPERLYMRQGGLHGSTTLISGPVLAGPVSDAAFLGATADGSQVFYTTESRLAPDDGNDGRDIYRYTVGQGNACITCAVADAQVIIEAQRTRVLVAESGERVYFMSGQALAAGATAGKTNLYVWRQSDPSRIDFVAPVTNLSAGGTDMNSWASFDGSVIVFVTNRPEMDAIAGKSNGGFRQRYMYDDHSRSVMCVTCPLGGPRTDVGDFPGLTGMYTVDRLKPLTSDGRSYFFITGEPLVVQDVNETNDIYEWRGGRAALITDGRSANNYLTLFGASADGSDVLFMVNDMLTPDAREGSAQLYNARIGDGFPAGHAKPVCVGDGCQGRPGVSPERDGGDSPGGEDVLPVARAAFSVRALSRAQRVRLAAGRVITVRVKINRAGRVRASLGVHGSAVTMAARGAGSVGLRLRLNRKARQTLARQGELAVAMTVSFTGATERVVRTISLKGSK